jgi:DNA-binding beta-propeller fold protein YncE
LLVLVLAAAGVGAPAAEPVLEWVSTIPMPGVKGRIDHFSADPKNHRLFIAALGNDSLEVLDTRGIRHGRVPGLGEPQGVAYLADFNRLVISSGSAHRVDIVDAASLKVLKRIDGIKEADNVRYEPASRKLFVGYGKGALRIIDPASGESVGDIALPGHPESFQLEQRGKRVFVNVPSAQSVVVVDRATRETVATWPTPDASGNYAMALDEEGRRLFVAARLPAVLLVYDTDSGKVVARVPVGQDTDDLFFDAERRRIYAICGEGSVKVIRQENPDRYELAGSISTAPRARTGLFVPEEGRLYVGAPASGESSARVLVYRAR